MRYRVEGLFNGRRATLAWENGKVQGDYVAAKIVKSRAKNLEGQPVGPVGQYTTTAHLKDPNSVLEIIKQVFDQVDSVTGDVPVAAELPPDAIG